MKMLKIIVDNMRLSVPDDTRFVRSYDNEIIRHGL